MSSYQGGGRHSLRLAGYNYGTSGAYYVTFCTHLRQPLLLYPQLRPIIEKEWQALSQRFPAVTLDVFAIMPDHMHCLLWIDAAVKRAPTLFTIMKTYKGVTAHAWTKLLEATNLDAGRKLWQRYYYDEIIRDERHLQAVRQYILDNPAKANA